MSFRSWLSRKTSRAVPPSRPRRFRPGLEALEDRLVLSTITWTGASLTSSNWTDAANWEGGKAPVAGDDLVFDAGAQRLANTNNYGANTAIRSLTFNGAGYALGGNAISLGAGGISSTVRGTNTAAFDISLPTTQTVTAASGATLTLGGALSGIGGLTKAGTGTVLFSGTAANTYAGTTTVTAGTLVLSKSAGVTAVARALVIGQDTGTDVVRLLANGQIADTAAVTVHNSGVLDLLGSSDTIGPLTMTGGQVTGTGTLTLNGNVTATSRATISAALSLGTAGRTVTVNNATSDLVISGAISGGAGVGLTKAGAGTLEFAGTQANTYAGTTTVNAGTLRLEKSGSVNAVAGALVIGDGSGTKDLVMTGPGPQISSRSAVTVKSSGVLDLRSNEIISSLTMTGGRVDLLGVLRIDGVVSATSASAGNPAQIVWVTRPGLLTLGTATKFDVRPGSGGPDLVISAPISATTGGVGGLLKVGAGTLRLAGDGPNSYSGMTTVQDGVLELDKSAGAQAVNGGLTIGNGSGAANTAVVRLLTANQLPNNMKVEVERDGRLDLNNQNEMIGPLTMHSGSVTTGTGLLTLNGDVTALSRALSDPAARISGKLSLGAATRQFNVSPNPPITTTPGLIVDAAISGTSELHAGGGGTLRLEGGAANTYAGVTRVQNALLELNKSSGTAVPGTLVIGDKVGGTSTDAVRLLAKNQLADNGWVRVYRDGLLDLKNQNEAIGRLELFGGNVTTGTGTLTLNGDVTATSAALGAARIAGRLNLGTAARTFTVDKGSSAEDLVVQGSISAPSGLIKEGDGTLQVGGGENLLAVAATVNAGTLRVVGSHTATTVLLNAGTLEAFGAIRSITTGTNAAKTVHMGDSQPSTLTVTNDVTFSATTTFQVRVRGGSSPKPGVHFDQLAVSGKVNLNGAHLSVALPGFVAPPKDTRFRFITGSVIGEFTNVPRTSTRMLEVALPDNKSALFRVDYAADGVDLVFRGVFA